MALIDEDQLETASGGRSAVMKKEEEELFRRSRARIQKSRGNESEKKKEEEEEPIHLGSREQESKCRKKSMNFVSPVSSASAAHVMERAKEIQSSLQPELPSFIKLMLPWHVTGGFWLGLPKRFCDLHLPKQDSAIFLEDEDGKVYEMKFLIEKVGLSAGWRGFSIAHNLREGDVLVFQLVKPCHWKVFVSRVDNLDEVDGALSLLQLFPSCKGVRKRKHGQIGGKSLQEMSCEISVLENDRPDDGDQESEILDGIRFCEFDVRFEAIKQPEDFVVTVDGLVIGGELSSHLRNKYYELCHSQSHFLHDNLVKGLNCKLVVGIISETVNIADAIRASKVTTLAEDFAAWEKTLRAFQDLGMDVGFLLTRLGRLVNIAAIWKSLRAERGDDGGKRVRRLKGDEFKASTENIASLALICQGVAKRTW